MLNERCRWTEKAVLPTAADRREDLYYSSLALLALSIPVGLSRPDALKASEPRQTSEEFAIKFRFQ